MPIITISRGSLSGGRELAERLGHRLGYNVVSQQQLIEAGRNYGVTPEDYSKEMTEPGSLWQRLTHPKERERYIQAARAALVELLASGDGIYHGHVGHFLLEGLPNVLRLRLIAPMDYRVEAAMNELSLSSEQAIKHIHDVDERRVKWVRQVYGVDWHDPNLYDLAIDLDHMSLETAVESVARVVEQPEFRSTSKSTEQFEDYALTARVWAALLFKSPFSREIEQVTAKDGLVNLVGGTDFDAKRSEIAEFVRRIPGVRDVEAGEEGRGPERGLDAGFGFSEQDRKASEVMLPTGRYPMVYEGVSIRDAIVALSASSVQLEDSHLIHPRYVLVLDRGDRLVGIVKRRDLIRGLLPRFEVSKDTRRQLRGLVPFQDDAMQLVIEWSTLFSRTAVEASKQPVSTVTKPVKGVVSLNDSLSDVITTMLKDGVDLAPVTDGDRLAGVVLMTDVFDIVAQFVMESGGRRRSER